MPSPRSADQNGRKQIRNRQSLLNSGLAELDRKGRDSRSYTLALGPVALDIVRGSAVPMALFASKGMSLLVCLKGEAFLAAQQASFTLGPRNPVVILPMQASSLLLGAGALVIKVTLPAAPDLQATREAGSFDHLLQLIAHLANVYFDDAYKLEPSSLRDAYGALILEAVRADLMQARMQDDVGTEKSLNRLEQAKKFIRDNLSQRIRLSDVARELAVSTRTVQLLFAQEAGTSLTRFVNEMRIEAAHQLLLQADHQSNVTQIALDCGFNHTGLFSAAYRRVYGELPRDTLARARRGAGVPSSFDPRFEVAS